MEGVRAVAPNGFNHIVEVAFGANIKADVELLGQGGSIATYATNAAMVEIPVWQLVFINARLFFVGSDDIPIDAKLEATHDISRALAAGWPGLLMAKALPAGRDRQGPRIRRASNRAGARRGNHLRGLCRTFYGLQRPSVPVRGAPSDLPLSICTAMLSRFRK